MKIIEEVITGKGSTWPKDVYFLRSELPDHNQTKLQKQEDRESFMELFAPELFYQIILKLSACEVSACMRVCKRWKKLLTSRYFWQRFTNQSFNFSPVIKVSGMLYELTGNWNYGWGSQLMSCPPEQGLFLNTPSRCKSGIIVPMDINPYKNCHDFKELFQALHVLKSITTAVKENSIVFAGHGKGKGDCPIDTFIFPWDHDVLPSKQRILEMFHINELVTYKTHYTLSSEPLGTDIDLESLFISRKSNWNPQNFCSLLTKTFDSYCEMTVDYLGRTERYRPKVVFLLTQLSTGWAGGILTGLW